MTSAVIIGAGAAGLAAGRALADRGIEFAWFERNERVGGLWQIENPGRPNYVSAECSRPGVKLTLARGIAGPARPFCNRPDNFSQSLKARMRYTLEVKPDKPLTRDAKAYKRSGFYGKGGCLP